MAKKALVTGDSRGLGAAIVRGLRDSGYQVLGVSRSGSGGSSVRLDLSDPDATAVWAAGDELGGFLAGASEVVLVNNAGTVRPIADAGDQGARPIISAVNLNVTAALVLTDAVLGRRPEGASVRVVHISSGAGRRPYPGWSVYCATKAALDMHALAVASEEDALVRIESIAPGVVDTDMQGEIRDAHGFRLRDRFVELRDSGELLRPEDAAGRVLARLASDDFGARVVSDVRD